MKDKTKINKMMAGKFGVAAATLAVATSMALSTASACTLPYVDDVNDWGTNKSILTVSVASAKAPTLRVFDVASNKQVKVQKVKKRVWLVIVKNKRTYKLQTREGNGKWKSIRYRIG